MEGWSPSQMTSGRGRGTSWTGQPITLRATPTDRVSSSPLRHVLEEWEEAEELAEAKERERGKLPCQKNKMSCGQVAAGPPCCPQQELNDYSMFQDDHDSGGSASLATPLPLQRCSVYLFSLQCWTTSVAPSKPSMGETPSRLTCQWRSYLQAHIKQQVIAAAKTCTSQNALQFPGRRWERGAQSLPFLAKAAIIPGRRPWSHIRTQK